MKHIMEIMDSSGHTTLAWNDKTAEAVAAAQQFAELIHTGYKAFPMPAGAPITNFDDVGEKVLMVPKIVGG